VVLITQDAFPINELWLQNLVMGFEHDEKIAGIYCRQIPHSDADPLLKRQLNNWLTGSINKKISFISDKKAYENLTPMQKYIFCNFDDVCSCIRRSIWAKFPFKETYFAEDLEWSKKILEAGYKIMYQPASAVIHSHQRSILYEYRRTYLCHRKLYNLFRLQTVPSFGLLIKLYFSGIYFHTKFILQNGKKNFNSFFLICRNFFLSFATILAQYNGAKDEIKSTPIKKMRDV